MATNSQTLSALLKHSSINDHEEVLKACNISLKQSKADADILHIKVVALLKLDRYEDALRALEGGNDNLQQKAKLEKAYALYKIGELEQAKGIAKSITGSRGAKHIEAQAVCKINSEQLSILIFAVIPARGLFTCCSTIQRSCR